MTVGFTRLLAVGAMLAEVVLLLAVGVVMSGDVLLLICHRYASSVPVGISRRLLLLVEFGAHDLRPWTLFVLRSHLVCSRRTQLRRRC